MSSQLAYKPMRANTRSVALTPSTVASTEKVLSYVFMKEEKKERKRERIPFLCALLRPGPARELMVSSLLRALCPVSPSPDTLFVCSLWALPLSLQL